MAVTARMHTQRSVKRGSWGQRFTLQKPILRGTTVESGTAPTLTSINPATAETDTVLTVTCTGTGFVNNQTVITVNGIDRQTTYVSATSATTSYRTPSAAGTSAFLVRNGPTFSTTPRTFTTTEPEE